VKQKKMTSQHMTSFLDNVHEGVEIVLDFRTKKAMMETIMPMIEIILPVMDIIKSAKICKPGLQRHPGHKVSSTELTTQVQCSS
jgi:hypothetical protein